MGLGWDKERTGLGQDWDGTGWEEELDNIFIMSYIYHFSAWGPRWYKWWHKNIMQYCQESPSRGHNQEEHYNWTGTKSVEVEYVYVVNALLLSHGYYTLFITYLWCGEFP